MLREIIISLTNRCNLHCRMCDIPANTGKELSADVWKKAIHSASACGAQTVVFSGGEPLLRDDIFELITFSKNEGLNACITSNGVLMRADTAKNLKGAGVDVVNISLEGPSSVHEFLRGEGTYQKVLHALRLLREQEIEVTVATMVSRHNYNYLTSIIAIACQLGVTTVKFQPFSRIFLNDVRDVDDFFVPESQRDVFKAHIQEVIIMSRKNRITTNPVSYLEKLPDYLTRKIFSGSGGCQALFSSCPIDAQGNVYPCWVITGRESIVGNVSNERLEAIWDSLKHRSIIAKISAKGCPGCLLSCYDDNFGRDSIIERIDRNSALVKKEGVVSFLQKKLLHFMKRCSFYLRYRGSIKNLLYRAKGHIRQRQVLKIHAERQDAAKKLQEIHTAKKLLQQMLDNEKIHV